jgi:hypothetical protein
MAAITDQARSGLRPRHRILLLTLGVLLNLGVPLLVLEWIYRAQIVDAYKPELRSFNPVQVLVDDSRPTLLVMGDSFTEGRTSYAGMLQDTLQEWRVINASVGGTGVLQALYMAPNRFAQFHPTIFVYQVYVGNDLFDIRYPINWRTISPIRNIYWFLANHLRFIGYLNYRLGQVKAAYRLAHVKPVHATAPAAFTTEPPGTFDAEHYEPRIKAYLHAEPSLWEDTILVQNRRQRDYAIFLEKLEQLLAYCKQEVCRAYILVIPHRCQVEEACIAHMTQLGARFTTPAAMRLPEYPFLVGIRKRFASWSHVQVLNPLPVLQQEAAKQDVYYSHDDHLNPQGQRTIAAFLTPQLHLR